MRLTKLLIFIQQAQRLRLDLLGLNLLIEISSGSVSIVGVLDGWPISRPITHIERTGALIHCCDGILVAGYLEFEHEIACILVHAVITSALRQAVAVKSIGAVAVETESS